MDKQCFLITENDCIARGTWRMTLLGDASAFTRPGQFAEIALPGRFLRRPISVCRLTDRGFTIIYRVVGAGTQQLSNLLPGTTLDVLTGLGNGYDVSKAGPAPLLVGGGCGCPPLLELAAHLLAAGRRVHAVLGFNTADEIFLADELAALGALVTVTTMDGSAGQKGLVTDAMAQLSFSDFFACGPLPMMCAVCAATDRPGQVSLEARMGCGFGACVGCTIETARGPRRVCKDGPVFDRADVLWDKL